MATCAARDMAESQALDAISKGGDTLSSSARGLLRERLEAVLELEGALYRVRDDHGEGVLLRQYRKAVGSLHGAIRRATSAADLHDRILLDQASMLALAREHADHALAYLG